MPSISSLHLYPVKSCRGIAVAEAVVTAAGLEHDREWMVATPLGRFVTQREEPRLALVAAAAGAELLVLHAVDYDQPRHVVEAERREASPILLEQVAALRQASAHPILPLIEEGDPF